MVLEHVVGTGTSVLCCWLSTILGGNGAQSRLLTTLRWWLKQRHFVRNCCRLSIC